MAGQYRTAVFQSLNRDSGCSDKRAGQTQKGEKRCFNPSIGILVVQTRTSDWYYLRRRAFQSLNRDSGCSDLETHKLCLRFFCSFNPSIGILVVQTRRYPRHRRPHCRFNPSIGILVVQTKYLIIIGTRMPSFNPSIGILVVQTRFSRSNPASGFSFQSLNRDSGCSDAENHCLAR